MTKIRTRTYIKFCKGRRVLTQYVQKKEEKPRPPPQKKPPYINDFWVHILCQKPVIVRHDR